MTTGSPLGDDIPVGPYDELGRSGYPQGNFHLIERYTPIDANTMNNYGLRNALSVARYQEKLAAEAAKKKGKRGSK